MDNGMEKSQVIDEDEIEWQKKTDEAGRNMHGALWDHLQTARDIYAKQKEDPNLDMEPLLSSYSEEDRVSIKAFLRGIKDGRFSEHKRDSMRANQKKTYRNDGNPELKIVPKN